MQDANLIKSNLWDMFVNFGVDRLRRRSRCNGIKCEGYLA
jgi:hypothetical protein